MPGANVMSAAGAARASRCRSLVSSFPRRATVRVGDPSSRSRRLRSVALPVVPFCARHRRRSSQSTVVRPARRRCRPIPTRSSAVTIEPKSEWRTISRPPSELLQACSSFSRVAPFVKSCGARVGDVRIHALDPGQGPAVRRARPMSVGILMRPRGGSGFADPSCEQRLQVLTGKVTNSLRFQTNLAQLTRR